MSGVRGPALPACEGGTPIRTTLLPYGRQTIDDDDVQAVVETLRSDWLTSGPRVGEFEDAVASYVGARYAVAYSSGTSALHGAVFAAGLEPGDEAIVSPLTFCATSNAVIYQGATPVFADVTPDTLNLDLAAAASRVTARTRAIMPVDYAGHPADLDGVRALADKHGVTVIEDACHALGAVYRQRRVGQVSTMTVFSFHPVKHVATGEGGMVTTNDEALARRLRLFRSHGIDSDARQRHTAGQWHYSMVALGYNYRLTDVASALGLSQMRKLDANLARRRAIAARYVEAFAPLGGITTPAVRPEVEPAWHLYPIRVSTEHLRVDREGIFRALRAEGLGVNVHYVPVHLHPYYQERFGHRTGDYPVAEHAYSRLISLPMFHGMTDADVQDVIDAVTKVVTYYGR